MNYYDEKHLKSNIKLLFFILLSLINILILCIILNNFIEKKQKNINIENSENIFGDIKEDNSDLLNYPKIIDSKELKGNTVLNLYQKNNISLNYSANTGLVTSNKNYIVYSKYDNNIKNFNLIKMDKKTKEEIILFNNINLHFLSLYDNFIIGVYDKNYNNGTQKDCILILNINNNKKYKYDNELGNMSGRIINSAITNGNKIYFTDYITNSIYSIDFNGKNLKNIHNIQKYNINDYLILQDIKDDKIYFHNKLYDYTLDLKSLDINYYDINSYFPIFTYNNQNVLINKNKNFYNIFIDNNLIYEGNLTAVNYDESIYFADNNILYKYNGNINKILETEFIIKQIYIDSEFIILLYDNGTINLINKGEPK